MKPETMRKMQLLDNHAARLMINASQREEYELMKTVFSPLFKEKPYLYNILEEYLSDPKEILDQIRLQEKTAKQILEISKAASLFPPTGTLEDRKNLDYLIKNSNNFFYTNEERLETRINNYLATIESIKNSMRQGLTIAEAAKPPHIYSATRIAFPLRKEAEQNDEKQMKHDTELIKMIQGLISFTRTRGIVHDELALVAKQIPPLDEVQSFHSELRKYRKDYLDSVYAH